MGIVYFPFSRLRRLGLSTSKALLASKVAISTRATVSINILFRWNPTMQCNAYDILVSIQIVAQRKHVQSGDQVAEKGPAGESDRL